MTCLTASTFGTNCVRGNECINIGKALITYVHVDLSSHTLLEYSKVDNTHGNKMARIRLSFNSGFMEDTSTRPLQCSCCVLFHVQAKMFSKWRSFVGSGLCGYRNLCLA